MNAFSVDSGDTGSPTFASFSATLQPNRAERRGIQPAEPGPVQRLWKAAAFVALFGILHTSLPPLHQLVAQPLRSFEESSQDDVARYVDRANRATDLDVWNNYVTTGIAQERIEWEEESYAALRQQLLDAGGDQLDAAEREALEADLEAQFEAARLEWESDATNYFLSERGEYRAE